MLHGEWDISSHEGETKVTIVGKVVDGKRKPLIGATVALPGIQGGTVVGLDGSFVLENVPIGKLNLIVQYIGYSTIRKQVEVDGSEERIVLDFEMRK